MKLVRVRWFNWVQHDDDQGEVHSHRIRYCRCYPVGHRTAGKCDRRFLPWFRIDGQFSAHSNWRVRARARAPNNHSLEAWAPPLGASCIGFFSSRCFKLTADCPQFPLGHAVARLQELRAPEGETIPSYTRSELLRYLEPATAQGADHQGRTTVQGGALRDHSGRGNAMVQLLDKVRATKSD